MAKKIESVNGHIRLKDRKAFADLPKEKVENKAISVSKEMKVLADGTVTFVEAPKDRYKGLKVSDFSISSLVAGGATDLLQGRVTLDGAMMENIDVINNNIENFSE